MVTGEYCEEPDPTVSLFRPMLTTSLTLGRTLFGGLSWGSVLLLRQLVLELHRPSPVPPVPLGSVVVSLLSQKTSWVST